MFTASKQSCGQGNIFAPVCHSVHRGGLPHCILGYTPPGPEVGTPREQASPWEQTPHWEQNVLGANTPPPRSRYPHPTAVHAGRYGQQAGGTHPTGMQSCFIGVRGLPSGQRPHPFDKDPLDRDSPWKEHGTGQEVTPYTPSATDI